MSSSLRTCRSGGSGRAEMAPVYIMCGRSDVKINYTLVSCDADSLAVNGDFQFAGMFSFLFVLEGGPWCCWPAAALWREQNACWFLCKRARVAGLLAQLSYISLQSTPRRPAITPSRPRRWFLFPAVRLCCRGVPRVNLSDRSGQTGAVRYRYTGPVWPETGINRSNSNLNSKNSVQPVRTGIPAS